MSYSSDLSSEEVPLFPWEGWISVQGSIQISSHHMLDEPAVFDVLWVSVRKLDPVFKDVVSHPIHFSIDSLPSSLYFPLYFLLLIRPYFPFKYPVIRLQAVELSPESKHSSPTDSCMSSHRML